MDALLQGLKTYFGYDSFRPGQEALVRTVLQGGDALGVMPTGAGKSVCYQLPALLRPGTALVVSPLISLMQDQVRALLQMGVPAAYLNSSLSEGQMQKALANARAGRYKIIYVAPERLLTRGFLAFAQETALSLVAVDEAHCVSQWGQDFRPSYLSIPRFLELLAARPPVCAFTATATERVREDIERLLELRSPRRLVTGFDRPNLFYEVQRPRNKDAALLALVREFGPASGIVYCATRRTVDEVQALLAGNGVAAARYHAGMDPTQRQRSQEDFLFDRTPVMVATNAFGMGIDKSNVRYVIHYNMPKDLESYYQEAGRGGRDGESCRCVLLFGPRDVQIGRFLIEHGAEPEELDEEQRRARRRAELERLAQMEAYCRETGCLRAKLLRYFGEQGLRAGCGACGNCLHPGPKTDIGPEALRMLDCVLASGQRYGQAAIAEALRGVRGRRTAGRQMQALSSFGSLGHLSQEELTERFEHLLSAGLLEKTQGQYPVLRVTQKGLDFARHGGPLPVRLRAAPAPGPRPAAKAPVAGGEDPALFERLRALRAELASLQGVPAFVVFSDATLHDMCRRRPQTMDELLLVSGVGLRKQAQYGRRFLQALQEYRAAAGTPDPGG